MADVKKEIVVSPLFYDALSGEFAPTCDPEKRKHTLGRLCMAAVQKGEATQVDRWRRGFEYEPSWAPGVLATAVCSHMSHEIEVLRLAAIDLASADGDRLTVIEEDNALKIIENEIIYESIPFQLGPDIVRARRIATDRAESFFRQI